jgi:hypothetical protein
MQGWENHMEVLRRPGSGGGIGDVLGTSGE